MRLPMTTKVASAEIHTFTDSFGVTQVYIKGNGFIPKPLFNAAMNPIKSLPSGKRQFDSTTKVWYIHNDYWQGIREFYVQGFPVYRLIEHRKEEDFDFAVTGNKKVVSDRPADFFNHFNTTITKIADTKSDRVLLAQLLEVSSFDAIPSDKNSAMKLYKRAALKHHPDRNSGNGHNMSELNRLWREYVQPSFN